MAWDSQGGSTELPFAGKVSRKSQYLVHDRQLRRFREAVRLGAYDLTLHGLDEMEHDRLSVLDLESCVLTGSIGARQRDRLTGEWKYVIQGRAAHGREIAVVVKWLPGDKMAMLTAYRI